MLECIDQMRGDQSMTKSDKPTRKATPAKRTAKRKVQQESTKFKIDGKEVQHKR
jgi:hypothetical protein